MPFNTAIIRTMTSGLHTAIAVPLISETLSRSLYQTLNNRRTSYMAR